MIRKLVILIVAMFGLGCHTQAQTNITNTSDSILLTKSSVSMFEDKSINDNSYSTINCYEKTFKNIFRTPRGYDCHGVFYI